MYHQIQEQEQVQTSQTNSNNRSKELGMKRAKQNDNQEKQITVAMVMDPDSLSQQAPLRMQIALSLKNSTLFSEDIGKEERYKNIFKKEIEESPLEKLMSKWVITFLKCMNY